MQVSEVLNYIQKSELERLSIEYKVDYQVKKLDGQTMFQLLLFSMLNVRRNSLRVMEEFYHSLVFKSIANTSYQSIKYNSIRDRLVNINPDYFEAIFKSCLKKYQDKYLKKKHNIISFDSTLVAISSKLLREGMTINQMLSRNSNGIKVVLYMTLITAILLTVYKKENNLKGYKIPKLKFVNELEVLIVKDIVEKCGGNPNQIDDILKPK